MNLDAKAEVTSSGLVRIKCCTRNLRQKLADATAFLFYPVPLRMANRGFKKTSSSLAELSGYRYSGKQFSKISFILMAHPLAISSEASLKKVPVKKARIRS